jgi:hypothetical protein
LELIPDSAQRRYARALAWGARIGIALLVLGFAAYLFGLTPHIPIERVPGLWSRPSSELLEQAGLRPGWHWAALVHRSDMLVLAAIAFLATCSLGALAAVVPIFHRRREYVFVAICILQVVVLLLAASGVLTGGH